MERALSWRRESCRHGRANLGCRCDRPQNLRVADVAVRTALWCQVFRDDPVGVDRVLLGTASLSLICTSGQHPTPRGSPTLHRRASHTANSDMTRRACPNERHVEHGVSLVHSDSGRPTRRCPPVILATTTILSDGLSSPIDRRGGRKSSRHEQQLTSQVSWAPSERRSAIEPAQFRPHP
jgi:hypothetical protein